MVNLTHSVNLVIKELIGIVTAVPRLREQQFEVPSEVDALNEATDAEPQQNGTAAAATEPNGGAPAAEETKEATRLPTYHHIISNDNDVLKFVVQIMNGMSASATELQKYLTNWDKYKAIWEMDKE